MGTVKALIITGYGINCEKEMAVACSLSGAEPTIAHAYELLNDTIALGRYHLLAFPGGFSFGDELGAGKAFANRLSYSHLPGKQLKEELLSFAADGNCILGICNGFQLLVKLGLLPGLEGGQAVSLTGNDSCRFESRWVNHAVLPGRCVFTKGLEQLYLPVRHGEGKLIARDPAILEYLEKEGHIVLKYADQQGVPTQNYPENPNGSGNAIGGLCDRTGRIFGMMAHPEAALLFTNHPQWVRLKEQSLRSHTPLPAYGSGYEIFKNATDYLRSNLCLESTRS